MRWILRGLLLVALLVVGAYALMVGPALRQVRGIEPPLPTAAELRALLEVTDGPTRVTYLNTSTQSIANGELGHVVFVAEWPDGRLFMIDASMDRSQADDFAELVQTAMGGGDAVFHGSAADLLGERARQVQGVAFTHLHIDHTQGVEPFCAVRGSGAAAFQTSWQLDEHNFNTTEGARIVADSCLRAERLPGEGLVTLEAFPGLGIAALGGHTPGSTLFAVAAENRLWIFSGDTTNSKADLLEDRGKGWLYSWLAVPEHTGRTGQLRRWLAELDAEDDTTVIVSHDIADTRASGMRAFESRSSASSR